MRYVNDERIMRGQGSVRMKMEEGGRNKKYQGMKIRVSSKAELII